MFTTQLSINMCAFKNLHTVANLKNVKRIITGHISIMHNNILNRRIFILTKV